MGYFPVDKIEMLRMTDYGRGCDPLQFRFLKVRVHYMDMGGPDGEWVETEFPGWDSTEAAMLHAVNKFKQLAM